MSVERIFYLTPDSDTPSWGVGLLYHHVRLLRRCGFEAWVLHQQRPFRLTWLEMDLPIAYLGDETLTLQESDTVVVPEVLANSEFVASLPSRRIVFVQGSFLILAGAPEAFDYREMGFEAALATMPHMRDIVSRHFGLEPVVVPPFIAPYFFSGEDDLDSQRERRVLLVGKPDYLRAGYLDYEIVGHLLRRHFRRLAEAGGPVWEIAELKGRTHRETAELMRRSEFLVNLNTLEGFNVTVPEAMAAGCVPVCYEAFGGRDFLEPGRNAYVFPNNHVYPLAEKILDLTGRRNAMEQEIGRIRLSDTERAGL